MENTGEWPNSEVEEIAWLDEWFGRMADDLDCARKHWDAAKGADVVNDDSEYGDQMYQVAKHCENLKLGLDLAHHTFVERFCKAGVVARLVIDKLSQQTGEEFKIIYGIEGEDGTAGFLLERQTVDVPDDASELDKDGGS